MYAAEDVAEIRLLIYEQAALLDQRLIKLDRRAAENQETSYRGDTFNFLQTSAQVRSEFGPIYHRNARFALSKQDVVRFWTGLIKNGLPLAAITILIVSTNPLPGFSHSQITRGGRFSANDFFPILEMYLRTSTACELRIAEYNEERQVAVPRQPVQLALDILTKGNDRWKSDIRNRRVSQVLVQSSGSFCQIRIIYKSPHEQPWMRNMLSFDVEVQQWASALGFIAEGESKLPDCVRLSFGVFY